VSAAKAGGGAHRSEATHWAVAAFDPSMILFNSVIEKLAGPVSDIRAELAGDCARVAVMPVCRYPRRSDAGRSFGRSKECLCRSHVTHLAQHHIHQRAGTVDRSIQITPSAVDFDVGLVDSATA
jgi:hypothetical protein